jgi:monoamine oxidase
MSTTIPRPGSEADVVVVGAGLSGLICARSLGRSGLAVRLLEARERWGGRMHRGSSATGIAVDLGGQWVGASHRHLLALLEEFDLRRYPTHYDGDGVFLWNGVPHRGGVEHDFSASLLFFRPQELGLPPAGLEQALAVQKRFQSLVERVPTAAPWETEGAEALDRISIEHWLERQGAGDLARYPLAWLTRMGGSGGFEPHESSILHLAWSQAVAPQQETPEAWLVEGGIAQVAAQLASELEGLIQLRAPVVSIHQNGGGVAVGCAGGPVLHAAAAVVAIPPPLRLAIHYEPTLPPQWRGLLQRSPMGSMVKVLALYERPFWREQGLNGLGIGNLPTLELTVDSSPPGGPGVLAGFIAGDRAVRWQRLSESRRRQALLADLRAWWGEAAAEPLDLIAHNWNAESWSGGAFTSFLTPGAWTSYGSIWQQPHQRVVWAGTEAAHRWPGYFEGAIEAGLAAADQVRSLLGG